MKKLGLTITAIFFSQIIIANITHYDSAKTEISIIEKRLKELNERSPIQLVYNSHVEKSIKSYLGKNKKLIARMVGLAPNYFPMFESHLDKYDIPLEFKYLAIVESALNPRATSRSGAKGLWQFMYLTGKHYNLNVTSYVDERQDPLKSTEAACQYFAKLYEMFGDWSLVLAAYNGGPGYLSRTMAKKGLYNYWDLRPYLRKETRGYVPAFIAVNYVMNYYKEHDIEPKEPKKSFSETDTVTIKTQIEFSVLSEWICLSKETIAELNPSVTKDVFPKNTIITLPSYVVMDFIINEKAIYSFVEKVEKKEILMNETRLVYVVMQGDYLGKIARKNGVKIHEIRKWNKLKSDNLCPGEKLVLFVKKEFKTADQNKAENPVYTVKEGDTLWEIAKKHEGISVEEIIEHNKINPNKLKPGEKIILPTS